ncbi:MAG: ubiquinone/menaquinone biosynthesis methyltransferase [Bryobacteraceae bacterium]
MHTPIEKRDSRRMREMFDVIAPRYDFITRLFSYGMDSGWKRSGVEMASLPPRPVILDLACGTADYSKLVRDARPGARTVAVDLTHHMLRLARAEGIETAVCSDAMRLPFRDHAFDCVFVGYGLRNFPHLENAVAEIHRVTRPGGMLVSLDFFLPRNPLWRRLYLGYLFVQGGLWGFLLHGKPSIYTYIPKSLRTFVSIEEFTALLFRTGYRSVRSRGFILGGIGVHWATNGRAETS